MSDLAATAQRLRMVKQATREFLSLWAMHDPADRFDELEGAESTAADTELADFNSHDWSLMYRGSVLDD